MPDVDGRGLRAWRRFRGWDVPEMARQLRGAAHDTGVPIAAPSGLIRMINAWERGDHALTERYMLLYARALEIMPAQLGTGPHMLEDTHADYAEQWPAEPRPAQLPADITDFTGRQQILTQLRNMISPSGDRESPGTVPVVVVSGSGGRGKTSLAVHAAHQLRTEFPDGQFYVDLLGPTAHPQAPADVLARFLRDLGVDNAQIPTDQDERAGAYRTKLAGRRMLVLLDNARDAAQVRPLLPGSSTCGVLTTARNRMPDLASTRLIDLDVLDHDESLSLFSRIVGEERVAAEPDATARVLAACAGLPLAIRICAARLTARSNWTIETLADRLSDQHRRLDELKAGELAVRASFQVSFANLSHTEGVDPAHAFDLLGLWPGSFISLPAAAALAGQSLHRMDEALEVLVDAHLLESPAPDRYRFHDLLAVYAAERAKEPLIEAERRRALRRVMLWYLHTANVATRALSPNRTPIPIAEAGPEIEPLRFRSVKQALDWFDRERPNVLTLTELAATIEDDEIAWQLPAVAMVFFNRRWYVDDWIGTAMIALKSARRLGDRAGEATILNSLGMAHRDMDLETAVSYFSQAIALWTELENKRGESQSAANMADALLRNGRYAEVAEGLADVLELMRLAGDQYGEAISLVNGAEACIQLEQIEQAMTHLAAAREMFRELNDVRGEGFVMRNSGIAYVKLGWFAEAAASFSQAASMYHEIGEPHLEVDTTRRLGEVYRSLDRPAEAKAAWERALRLYEAVGDEANAAEMAAQLRAVE